MEESLNDLYFIIAWAREHADWDGFDEPGDHHIQSAKIAYDTLTPQERDEFMSMISNVTGG